MCPTLLSASFPPTFNLTKPGSAKSFKMSRFRQTPVEIPPVWSEEVSVPAPVEEALPECPADSSSQRIHQERNVLVGIQASFVLKRVGLVDRLSYYEDLLNHEGIIRSVVEHRLPSSSLQFGYLDARRCHP